MFTKNHTFFVAAVQFDVFGFRHVTEQVERTLTTVKARGELGHLTDGFGVDGRFDVRHGVPVKIDQTRENPLKVEGKSLKL